ncbi:MAG: YlbF family regulator [Sedimentisphaerales bacterium]|nr:YlbF family regulator [Sedimentisphaerales bacterium]
MKDLIEMAGLLGKKIAAHERCKLLAQAQEAVDADEAAGVLVREYHEQATKIQQLEAEGKPIEVADKHKLKELEEKISTNELLMELTKRQVDFVEMMHKVKEAIDKQMQGEKQPGQ